MRYPLEGELAAEARPRPITGISSRMSPADAWTVALLLWVASCAGAARFAMTRNALWFTLTAPGLLGLVVIGGLWYQDARRRERDELHPLLVVSDDTTLRKGNATAYPPRFDSVLPKGAEVRELSRRGGWVQVLLPGGAAGWIPAGDVIP